MQVTISKICAATDFSEAADHAVHYAAALAHHHQASLHIVHVLEHAGPLVHHPDFSHHGEVARAYFQQLEEAEATAHMSGKPTDATSRSDPAHPNPLAATEAVNAQALLEDLQARSRQRLETLQNDWWTGIDVQRIVRYGHPVEELCRYIRHGSIDLLVVGTRGRSRLHSLLVGSVTQRLVQLCPCPVLALRHPSQDASQTD